MKIRNKTLTKNDIFILKQKEIADPKFLTNTYVICVKVPSSKNDKYCAKTHKRI